MLRDGARAYAQDRLQPRAIAAFRDEHTDPAIFREMGEMGLLGVTIPEDMLADAEKRLDVAAQRSRMIRDDVTLARLGDEGPIRRLPSASSPARSAARTRSR